MTDAVPVMLNQVSTPAGVTEGWTAGGVRKCEVAAAVRFRGAGHAWVGRSGALRRYMLSRPRLPCEDPLLQFHDYRGLNSASQREHKVPPPRRRTETNSWQSTADNYSNCLIRGVRNEIRLDPTG